MTALAKFNSLVEALAEKVHDLGADQLTVALCAAAHAPVASNTVLANLTVIAYTNLSTRDIVTVSSGQVAGVYSLVLTDLVLTASGDVATFRYVVIYNDDATNKELIGWSDIGSNITLHAGETFTIDFAAGGAIQLT